VFESILAVRGRIVRLAGHLARLDLSCRELYGLGLPADLASTVQQQLRNGPAAERVVLRVTARPHAHGLRVAVEARPLGPRRTTSTLSTASRPQRSWRHKWLDRVALDAAEQTTWPAMPYFAAGGRVTETSRGNLFWRGADGVWCTPPLDEQVLPGVTRREVMDLLGRGGTAVQIRRGQADDLHRAGGAFWTSSLSGAVAVTAIDDYHVPDVSELLAELNALLGTV
jgi:para-aminobenzoate synthetase/4-amino-4-deoxychorismate lyase